VNIARSLRKLGLALAMTAMVTLAAGTAVAATDGVLGLTSTGDTIVSITKGEQALITGMLDIALAPWTTGQPAPAGATTSCIYTTTGQYQVTTSSLYTTGVDYRLSDGVGGFIVYTVDWNDGIAGLQPMAGGTALVGQQGDAVSQNCGGVNPATIAVAITVGEMNGAPVGIYADTLTVVIAPE
jgi:hypothetical protein